MVKQFNKESRQKPGAAQWVYCIFPALVFAFGEFTVSSVEAAEEAKRYLPHGLGFNSPNTTDFNPQNFSEEDLSDLAEILSSTLPIYYDRIELATYAPEWWKIPLFLDVLRSKAWVVAGGGEDQKSCEQRLSGLREWRGYDVLEPAASSFVFTDVALQEIYSRYPLAKDVSPITVDGFGYDVVGTTAFRAYILPGFDDSVGPFLTWEGGDLLFNVDPFGRRIKGPLLHPIMRSGSTLMAHSIVLKNLSGSFIPVILAKDKTLISRSYSYYFPRLNPKIYPEEYKIISDKIILLSDSEVFFVGFKYEEFGLEADNSYKSSGALSIVSLTNFISGFLGIKSPNPDLCRFTFKINPSD